MPLIREKYPAQVTKNEDPLKRGRVKVTCVGLMGDHETELPDWIEPATDWGWFVVPDIGELIDIECIASNDQEENAKYQAFLENPDLRWCGTRYQSPEGGTPRPPNDLMTDTNYGKRRGFATPMGHILMFDDTAGKQMLTLSWHRGTPLEYSQLTMNEDGSILLLDRSGNMINMNAKEGVENITIVDKNSNVVALDSSGLKLIDKFSNIIEMKSGVIQVLSQGDVVVNATKAVEVKAPGVLLGDGADQKAVRGDALNTYLTSTLSVPTAFGPSGPAIVPLTTELSTVVKVK